MIRMNKSRVRYIFKKKLGGLSRLVFYVWGGGKVG